MLVTLCFFFFQAEDGIRDKLVTGVQRVLFRSKSFGARQTREFFSSAWLEEQRDLRHALGAADYKYRAAPSGHSLVSDSKGFAAGRAIAMDCDGRNALRNTRAQRDHARHVSRFGRLTDAAENNLINQSRVEPGAGEQRVDSHAAQFICGA